MRNKYVHRQFWKKKKTWTLSPIRIYQSTQPHSIEYGTGPNTSIASWKCAHACALHVFQIVREISRIYSCQIENYAHISAHISNVRTFQQTFWNVMWDDRSSTMWTFRALRFWLVFVFTDDTRHTVHNFQKLCVSTYEYSLLLYVLLQYCCPE
jgi:hypothetical protein